MSANKMQNVEISFPLRIQYSDAPDGTFVDTFNANHTYMRFSMNNTTWCDAIRIVGESGSQGESVSSSDYPESTHSYKPNYERAVEELKSLLLKCKT